MKCQTLLSNNISKNKLSQTQTKTINTNTVKVLFRIAKYFTVFIKITTYNYLLSTLIRLP